MYLKMMRLDELFREIEQIAKGEIDVSRIAESRYIPLDEFFLMELEEEEEEELRVKDIEVDIEDLEPVDYSLPVVAIDSSSLTIGETEEGPIATIKLAIVAQSKNRVEVKVYGPLVCHLTSEVFPKVYVFLRNEILGLNETSIPPLHKAQSRLRNLIERVGQRYASTLIREGIVLWDGSMTQTIDTPTKMIVDSIKIAKENGNSIVAISKRTRLMTVDGKRITSILRDHNKACFASVDNIIEETSRRYLTERVFIVRFSPFSFSFRVDIAPSEGKTHEQVIRELYSSVNLFNGYPMPLKEAHTSCCFNSPEVIAIKAFLEAKRKILFEEEFDVRRFILYP